jgi:hypothetical protein
MPIDGYPRYRYILSRDMTYPVDGVAINLSASVFANDEVISFPIWPLITRKNHMTERRKLIALRGELIRCRRAIVDRFQEATTGQLNGDDIARIQDAIDAADRAIADEILAEYKEGRLRPAESRDQLP